MLILYVKTVGEMVSAYNWFLSIYAGINEIFYSNLHALQDSNKYTYKALGKMILKLGCEEDFILRG